MIARRQLSIHDRPRGRIRVFLHESDDSAGMPEIVRSFLANNLSTIKKMRVLRDHAKRKWWTIEPSWQVAKEEVVVRFHESKMYEHGANPVIEVLFRPRYHKYHADKTVVDVRVYETTQPVE